MRWERFLCWSLCTFIYYAIETLFDNEVLNKVENNRTALESYRYKAFRGSQRLASVDHCKLERIAFFFAW